MIRQVLAIEVTEKNFASMINPDSKRETEFRELYVSEEYNP